MSKELQYLNCIYYKQQYGKNKFDDKLSLVYRDLETNEKKVKTYDTPTIAYYINKDEFFVYPGDANYKRVNYIEKDKVDKIVVPYRNLVRDVAERLDETAFFQECIKERNMYAAKRLFLNPNVHQCDMDIEDYYLKKFQYKHPILETYKITKGYSDIEVDNYNYIGFPDEFEAPCKIDLVTYFDDITQDCYCFVLLLENSESQKEFLDNLEEEKKIIIKDIEEETKLTIRNLIVNIYDSEKDLIREYFELVNNIKPDFLGYWNMRFDINTFINRCIQNDMDPNDIICHKDFPYKICDYYTDNRNQAFADSADGFTCSSYTYYIDMMRVYASLRKTQGKKESYTLDYTANEELGIGKIQFDKKETIQNLAYVNFRKFIKYNIRDVTLLKLLEDKTNDISQIYQLAAITNTRYNKTMKKTTCLKNYAAKCAELNGYIASNNHNSTYGGDKVNHGKIRGAFVAEPNNNSNNGLLINGSNSMFIFEIVIDFDFSSLYPSIIRILNLDASQEYGKLYIFKDNNTNKIIDIKDYDLKTKIVVDKDGNQYTPNDYSEASWEFVDGMVSDDYIKFGKNWFNLPTPYEIINEVISDK